MEKHILKKEGLKMKLIRITTIYKEEIIRKEIKRDRNGIYTPEGYIPFDDIESIEIIGEIHEERN